MLLAHRVAVFGFGNMAKALFKGAAEVEACDPRCMTVCDPIVKQALEITPFKHAAHACDALKEAEVAWLCVKPDVVATLCREIAGDVSAMKKPPLFVSIAAGISEATIRDALQQPEAAVVRVMPNLPVLVGKGASGYYANSFVRPEQLQAVTSILNATGIAVPVAKESDLHAITAVSGSGPAYVLRFMREFIESAKRVGLSPEVARELVIQTMLGATELGKTSALSLDELCEQVRSKGGTTDAALKSFDENNLGQIVQDSVMAARDRSIELGSSEKPSGEPPIKKSERGVVDPRFFSSDVSSYVVSVGNSQGAGPKYNR